MQSGETKEDIIKKLKEYNRSLHGYTQMEREYIKEAEDTRYLYGFQIPNARIPDTLEELLKKQNNFKGLLPKGHEKLCEYLTHIQVFPKQKDIKKQPMFTCLQTKEYCY